MKEHSKTHEFIGGLVCQGYTATPLPSGKIRFTKDKESYLYSALDAIVYGTWYNEVTNYWEAIE